MNQGKYVFSQITEFIPRFQFNQCVDRYGGHYSVKNFSCFDQFLSMSFGQLTHRESLRDIINCLNSQERKLYHLGFGAIPKLPTLARANEKRDWRIYRDLAMILIERARKLNADDQRFELKLEGACYLIDSSIVDLCLNIFPWAKMKTVRAAIKLNLQMDLKNNIPILFSIDKANKHDLEFLDKVEIEAGAYYVLDRGYIDFVRLFAIDQAEAFFVIRAKSDLGFKRIYSNPVDKDTGLRCDQIIKLTHWKTSKNYPEKLRRVKFFDQENKRYFVFLTNDFNLSALTVTQLYKHRWQIELFFKWVKQHLKIKSFWGYSENAVKTQICIAICSYLLVFIIKKELKIDKNLYQILQILNVTLLTKNPLKRLLSETNLQELEGSDKKQASLWGY